MAAASNPIHTQNVHIAHVARVETLTVLQEKKTLWERFVEGASWSTGATLAGFVVYKTCDIAYNVFLGAQTGAAVGGASFGPNGILAGAVAGGIAGAVAGVVV